jgi:hypothetical protein
MVIIGKGNKGIKNLTEVLLKARGKYLREVIEDSAKGMNSGNFYGLVREDFNLWIRGLFPN